MRTAIEREAKFEGDPSTTVPTLTGVTDGASEVQLPTITLTATYYDTDDLRLLGRHLTLRHRHQDDGSGAGGAAGGEDGWTLKQPGGDHADRMDRVELTWPGPDGPVPAEVLGLTEAVTRGAALRPVAQIVTVRRRRELRAPTGRRLAEIDDDDVTGTDLTAPADGQDPSGPLRFREVEVEVDEGGENVLDRATRLLTGSGFAASDHPSKLRRVLAGRDAPATPHHQVGPRSTLVEVVTASVGDGLDRLVTHDLAVRTDGGPRGIHQARVATRRLRSDLKTFRELLDPTWVSHTRTSLKWVADALGEVRDADVLAERMARHRSKLTEDDAEGFDGLAAALVSERETAMVNLRDVLHRPRYLELLDELEHAAISPPWRPGGSVDPERPADRELGRLVRRPWRRLRRAVDRLGDDPDDRALHQVRIKAKQVRYAAETAVPVIGSPAERLARGAKALQSTLGDHHDAVEAEAWLRTEAAGATAPVALAAGQAIAFERRQQSTARRAWTKAWKKASRRSGRRWLR